MCLGHTFPPDTHSSRLCGHGCTYMLSNTPAHHVLFPVCQGMKEGSRHRLDKYLLWMTGKDGRRLTGNTSHSELSHGTPSHTSHTSHITVVSCITLLRLQTHPNIPTHTTHPYHTVCIQAHAHIPSHYPPPHTNTQHPLVSTLESVVSEPSIPTLTHCAHEEHSGLSLGMLVEDRDGERERTLARSGK